ncbi:hypothetical protein niasHT_009349 [Heterodera trifolii]|uniref:RING-type domain-containing protein n=1 Tax=Heterodera trifolii TaxID=157864 RepID=A0ABD2LZ93_9BILA
MNFHDPLTRLLRSIPTITVNSSSSSEFEHCVICLNEFIDGTKVKQLRECNHKFHVDCIKRWIFFEYNRCPLCGHQIFATPTTDRF